MLFPRRLRWRAWGRAAMVVCLFVVGLVGGAPTASSQPPPSHDDVLGTIPIYSQPKDKPLPKIAIMPSLASAMEDVTLRSVVSRDLELSGEFDILDDNKAPKGMYFSDTQVDVEEWKKTGVEAVVKLVGEPGADKDHAALAAQVYLVKYGDKPVYNKRFKVPQKNLRIESHRISDIVIGVLTGQDGGFASHLTFASGSGKLRRIFTIDADGHDAKAVSPSDRIALAPAYGPNDELYYSASVNKGEYKLYTESGGPIALPIPGSVYGVAWDKDRTKVAVSIGVDDSIRVFTGPDLQNIKAASNVDLAMRPTFTPTGKLAFSGAGQYGQRIFVDGKPISPAGLFSSAPTFCRHPDGIRAVYMVGVGKNTDLVASGETGGGVVRLTQNQGRNGYPSCSPDGRLIAFFTTRTSGEGPGLYIQRLSGGRPKRISTLDGDSLRWSTRVKGAAVELPPLQVITKEAEEPATADNDG